MNSNQVGASVHVDNNTGFEFIGPVDCQKNTPAPFSFGNVAGNFVGQRQM